MTRTTTVVDRDLEPDRVDLDRFTSYEDDGATVICDRRRATAWIRSDTVLDREP